MQIVQVSDAQDYFKRVQLHFVELKRQNVPESVIEIEKVKLNLFFSVVKRMISDPSSDQERYLIVDKEHPTIIRLAAVRTPPYNLILGFGNNETISCFARYLASEKKDVLIPGIVAGRGEAKLFCSTYFPLASVALEQEQYQLLYLLTDYTPPAKTPPGQMIYADQVHYELLIEWGILFKIDCKLPAHEASREQVEKLVKPRLPERGFVFWEIEKLDSNGNKQKELVSLAGVVVCDDNLVRIGMVFTPKEHRNHGYASILVNLFSKRLVDEGKQVVLYTDESNPVSNAIYYKIGYRQVAEQCALGFTEPLEEIPI
jgi:RimJ/RimL family protein N-acetyltransferase